MATCPSVLRNLSLLLRPSSRFRYYSSASSVNPREISHFDSLASTWWDPYGPFRLLHLMNPLRHDFISSCLSSESHLRAKSRNSLRYLDIGCGGGIFAESAARLPTTKHVTAIDPSHEAIAVAKAHACHDPMFQEAGRLEYLNKSIENLTVPQSAEMQFDLVTLFEVVEHIDHPAAFLDSCLPFVKPGGWLVLSTIARTWRSWLTTKVVAEDVAGLIPRGTHDWGKYINEEELREFFRRKDGWADEYGERSEGVFYYPGVGWRALRGRWGNYFFGVRRASLGGPGA